MKWNVRLRRHEPHLRGLAAARGWWPPYGMTRASRPPLLGKSHRTARAKTDRRGRARRHPATGTAEPPDPAAHGPRDTRARGPFFPSPEEAPDLRGMQAGSGSACVLTGGAGIGPRGFAGGLSRFPMSSTTSELFSLLGVRRVKSPCLRREILNI